FETPFRRNVPAEEKIHYFSLLLQIIGPFEVEHDRQCAARLPQRSPRNRQVQFVALHSELYFFYFLPLPAAVILLEPGGSIRVHHTIDNKIKALPAGGRVLIRIDQQPHPIGPSAGGDGDGGTDVEENLAGITRDFGCQNIAAAGVIS